PPIEVKH
ncbi:hypothetical protein CISIN_1g0415262mg, partial [Citrus sinensis]